MACGCARSLPLWRDGQTEETTSDEQEALFHDVELPRAHGALSSTGIEAVETGAGQGTAG
jgi:hypothetical protein